MQMQAGLVPGTYVGMGNLGTGCFSTGDGITSGNCDHCSSLIPDIVDGPHSLLLLLNVNKS